MSALLRVMAGHGRLLQTGLLLLCLLSFCGPARAACHNNVTVNETAALAFGTWQIPAGAGVTAVVSTAGSTTGSTGTPLYGTASGGHYSVTQSANGSCSGNVTISLTPPANCGTGCSLGSFKGSWNGGTVQSFPLTVAHGSGTLFVGATATYGSSVPAAQNTANYTLTFAYSGDTDNATESAAIGFDYSLSFSNIVNVDFGAVRANTAATYTISTAGTASTSGGAYEAGTPTPGSVTINGSDSRNITISASSGASTTNNGATITNVTCQYGATGTETTCSGSGINVTPPGHGTPTVMKIGVTVSVNGTQGDNTTATPATVITVVYQ